MSQEAKVSQYTALLIEQARRAGLSSEVIGEAVQTRNAQTFEQAGLEGERYSKLFSYAEEHGEPLHKAVQDGYRMTFNTRNGLKNWLVQRFELDEEKDFAVGEGIIMGLGLKPEQLEVLKKALAINWVITDTRIRSEGRLEVDLSIRALYENPQL